MRLRFARNISFLIFMSWLVGCAGSASVAPRFAVDGVTNARSLKKIFKNSAVHRFLQTVNPFSRAAGDVSQSGDASNITSLQFFITRIKLCKDLEVTGSGYQNEGDCNSVYVYEDGDNAYDTFKIADAASDTSEGWVDLMSEDSIDAFSARSGSVTAGTYNYGIIENRKPIKLNASFSTPNLGTVKTCEGGTITTQGSGLDTIEISTLSNMTTCTRATATIGTNGGGKWFKFQSPVTVESGKSYILDLAFNADNVVTVGPTGLAGVTTTYHDSSRSLAPPTLSVSPILRTSEQKTIREQYEISGFDTGVSSGKLVLDLYYVGTLADVGSGAIVGAQTNFVFDSNAEYGYNAEIPYAIETNGGAITVENYAGSAIVEALVRSTTQTPGGTQTINTAGGSATATFKGVTEL